jgi:antitoxin (DNA-binding transcriptional repressor) of toxin-antitoxin stability system
MKTITIRELHSATGKWVREASVLGELHVTERGRLIAKLLPSAPLPQRPFFARRKLTKAFRAAQPFLTGGPDSTRSISDDRDHEAP